MVEPLAPIELPLSEAHGCVLAADVRAEYDLPPFSSATVEGYAARSADIHAAAEETPVALHVVGRSEGGRPPDATVGWGEAVRVLAGAPVPSGADCVVPDELTAAEDESVAILGPVEAGASIDPAGRDLQAGEVLVPAGRKLAAPELAALAGAGQPAPPVYPKVRVAVLPVGEGMVEAGRPAGFGQRREASSFLAVGELRDAGAVPYRIPIAPFEDEEVREAVLTNLARADCFVCTIGASDEDLDPDRLAGLGQIEYGDVAMFPGMVHGFARIQGVPFFVLPGSPISTFVGIETLVRPAILRMMGRRDISRPRVQAVLDADLSGPSGVTLFAPAMVEHREGEWRAAPLGGVDPDRLSGLVGANGLIEVPPGETEASAGDEVRVHIFRPLER